jgi:hypothetical protein
MKINNLLKKKNAEMSSTTLVTVFLAIIGFVIMLFFFGVLDFGGQSNRDICHQSVVFRGTLPDTLGIQDTMPLKCTTEKVCVRGDKLFGKGKCSDFNNVKEITYVDVSNVNDVEKAIADETLECFNMMGQGELSLFSPGWAAKYGVAGGIQSSCVICSRIAFDEQTLKEKNIDISKRNVLNYMRTHLVPNGNQTYYDYFLKGKANVADNSINNIIIANPETGEDLSINLNDFSSELTGKEELAVLFMQVSAPSSSEVFRNTLTALGIGVGGAAVTIGPAGTIKLVGKCLMNPLICALVAGGSEGVLQGGAAYNRGVAATYCSDVKLGSEAGKGCSIVRTVNYNIDEIKQYCNVIESIS